MDHKMYLFSASLRKFHKKLVHCVALLSVSISQSSIDYIILLHSLFMERKLINEALIKPEQYKSAEFNRAVVKDS